MKRGAIYRQFLEKIASSQLCVSEPPDLLAKVFLAVLLFCLFSSCVAGVRFWQCR